MSGDRLIIVLDVDGVLNATGDNTKLARRGFVEHTVVTRHPQALIDRMITVRLRLHPEHGAMLIDLALRLDAELMWATTWNDEANREIAPKVGLPELPVIHVTPPFYWKGGAIWKHREVVAAAGTRPLVWLDDQFTKADKGWAGDRRRNVAPTRLVHVEECHGLDKRHLADIEVWWDKEIGTRRAFED